MHIEWMVTIATRAVTYGIFYCTIFFFLSPLLAWISVLCSSIGIRFKHFGKKRKKRADRTKIDYEIEIELTLSVQCSSHNSVLNWNSLLFFLPSIFNFYGNFMVLLIYAILNLHIYLYVNGIGGMKRSITSWAEGWMYLCQLLTVL